MHQQWEHPCLSYTQLQSMLQDEIIYTEIFLFKFDSYSVIQDLNYLVNLGNFLSDSFIHFSLAFVSF